MPEGLIGTPRALSRFCLATTTALLAAACVLAHPRAAAAPAPPDEGWPRTFTVGNLEYKLYQPQLDAWDGYRIQLRAVVSVGRPGGAPAFGTAWLVARSEVDRTARVVLLENLRVPRVRFPAAADGGYVWEKVLSTVLPKRARTIALDRIEAEPEILPATKRSEGPEPRKVEGLELRNDPPRIVFSPVPAVLLHVDGTPAWVPVERSSLKRLLNTRALVLSAPKGPVYLRLFDGWLEGRSIQGPWTVSKKAATDLDAVARRLATTNSADFADARPYGPGDPRPNRSIKKDPVPAVVLTTVPTELIVLDGQPRYLPIEGTQLLYVENTAGNVFKHLVDRRIWVLLAGRWFQGPGYDGPWEFVPGHALPGDFASIPDTSPRANVKASVPGTRQALEAAAASTVPQVARVDRRAARLAVTYDGEPRLKGIDGTPLQYVMNSPVPVVEVDANSWYAVDRGVWFAATGPKGPWAVAASVPGVLYTIPPSSPVHQVTYVKILAATPDVVYVGATPGYTGAMVNAESVIVHGTGFPYPPWVGTRYFPPPTTYGSGAAVLPTPPTGRAVAHGFGSSGGSTAVAVLGARQEVANGDYYASRDGDVYRRDAAGGWSSYQPGGAGWVASEGSVTLELDGYANGRSAGEERLRSFPSSAARPAGGPQSGGGGRRP